MDEAPEPDGADVMITHRFPLDDGPEAFRVAPDRSSGASKVVLGPRAGPVRQV